MSQVRRRWPTLEPLEGRRVPVGFFEGTPSAPMQLALEGLARGMAVVRSSPTGFGSVVTVGASGRVSPLGHHAAISGTIRIQGTTEQGFLIVNAPKFNLTLRLEGPAPAAGGSAKLAFSIVHGQGVPTVGTYSYVREEGGGSVDVTLAPGPGRVPLTLFFHS